MELRLKAYLAEVEKALDNLASVVEKVEKGKGNTQIALAEKNIMLHYQILQQITVGQRGGFVGYVERSGADTLRKCKN